MLQCKKDLPESAKVFIRPSPFAVASSLTDIGTGLPANASSTSRGVRGVKSRRALPPSQFGNRLF